MPTLLEVDNLITQIPTRRGLLTAVDGVSFELNAGEVFGLVGESGSGKSMTCRSLLGLVPRPGRVAGGEIRYNGQDLTQLSPDQLNQIRGKEIAMIFQDAMSVLNPVLRIGEQIGEALLAHKVVQTKREAEERAIDLMRKVGIPDPVRRLRDYPHQFSGGMCQRVVIAIALACNPRIILADEPTTALDVTIQDQILKLLIALQRELNLSLLLVTHDMGVVAQSCGRVAVMYAGQIVEMAETRELFRSPRHPYTQGLLNCVPRTSENGDVRKLQPIPGAPPDLISPPTGCRFHPRCPLADDRCKTGSFPLRQIGANHMSACIKHEELADGRQIWPLSEAVPA